MSFVTSTEDNGNSENTEEPAKTPENSNYTEENTDLGEEPELVTLAWYDDEEEIPLPLAIEANAGQIAKLPDAHDLKGLQATVDTLSSRVNREKQDYDKLGELVEILDQRTDEIVRSQNKLSKTIRILLVASDIETPVSCPECRGHELEVKKSLSGNNRIHCEGCGYIAAKVE